MGRRVAIGAAATLGLAAFALVPTKDLRVVKPSKPMFFYITQLLQAQVGVCLGVAVFQSVWTRRREGEKWRSGFERSQGLWLMCLVAVFFCP